MHTFLKWCCLLTPLVFILTSCTNFFSDLAVPETLSVKSKADYTTSLGSVSDVLSKYLSASILQENIATSSTDTAVKVYDYNPANSAAVQEFLIEYPITEYQLDFNNMIDDALGSSLTDMSFDSYTISVPAVSQNFNQSMVINASDITGTIGDSVLSGSLPLSIPEAGAETSIESLLGGAISRPITIGVGSATYASGTLELNFEYDSTTSIPAGASPSGSKIINVTLQNSSGTTITSGTGTGTDGSDIYVSLPLAGKTLTQSMTLVVGGTVSGGIPGVVDIYSPSSSFSSAVLSRVTGITKSGITVTVPSLSVSVPNTIVSSATISEGLLYLRAAVPSGWSGVTATLATPTISGGLTPTEPFSDTSTSGYFFYKTLDLNGATYSPGSDVSIGDSTATVSLDNATIVFDTSGAASIPVAGNCSITKLSEVTIDPDSLSTVPSIELNKTLSEISSIVQSVKVASIAVSGSLTNGLSAGNDIELKTDVRLGAASCSDTETFDGGSSEAQEFAISCPDSGTVDLVSTSPVKITASILLPGQSSTGDMITLQNITLGSDYSFAASFGLKLGWESVTVDPSDIASELASGSVPTNIDFANIFNGFSDKIDLNKVKIKDIPTYLYVTAPESVKTALGSPSFKLTYTDDKNTTATLVDTSSDPDSSFTILTSDIDLGSTSGTFIGDLSDPTVIPNSTKTTAFTDIINNRVAIKAINYSMSLNPTGPAITIYNPGDGSSAATVSVKAIIELPLKLEVATGGMTVDLVELADVYGGDATKDLLDRDSDFDPSDITKYTDAIKSFTVTYSLDNPLTMPSSDPITIILSDAASGLSKTLSTSDTTLSLTSEEITNVVENTPFHPSMMLTIPEGEYSIPRDCKFGVNASVKIKTDGTVKIWGDD